MPERAHIPLGSDVELAEWIAAGGSGEGGATSLTDLTDVSGEPGPGKSPVGDPGGDTFTLTEVSTQEAIDEILHQVVWHRVWELTDPWQPSNPTAVMTPDGVQLGPYPDGAGAGGSVRYLGLNGQPFSAIRNLAYLARYTSDDGSLGEGSAPYLRVYTTDDGGAQHDAIFTPGSQPLPGLGVGPFQEWVATAGTWRWDDDAGTGGVPLAELQAQYGDQLISKLAITVGFTAGPNLAGLVRWWQINGDHLVFAGA